MFYPTGLLRHPNSLVLNLAWLAATRGTKSIKRDEVEKCDLTKLCKTILQFLQSKSSDPKKRFSLRLSAIFVHGTLLIYAQQAVYIESDILIMIKSREDNSDRLAVILNDEDKSAQDSFKIPTAAKKKRKRASKKEIETPPSLVEITKEVTAQDMEKTVDQMKKNITPSEVVQGPGEINDVIVGEKTNEPDVFPITREAGDLLQISSPLAPPRKSVVEALVHWPAEPEMTILAVQPEQSSLTAPPAALLPAVEPEAPLPAAQPEDTIVQAQRPMPEEIIIQEAPPVVPTEEPPVSKTPGRRRSAESESSESVTSRKEYRKKTFAQKLQIRPTKYPTIIDKDWIYVEEEFLDGFDFPLRKFIPTKKFWPDSDVEFRAGEAPAEPRGTDISDVPSYSARDFSTPRVSALSKGLSLADSHVRPVTSTPKRTASEERTIITEMAPAGHNGRNDILISPAKRRRIAPVVRLEEIEPFKVPEPPLPVMLPEDLPTEAPAGMPEEPLAKKLPSPKRAPWANFGQKWYDDILDIINAHFKILPEDICQKLGKRVSRANMAIVFASLLVLYKRRLVILRKVPGSSELDIVEKA